ncbi:MAG: sulfurtransferase TusA family protein [Candidatus Nanopelagicales bacterium]
MLTLDARGMLCPLPIIRLARLAAGLPPGAEIEVLSDDPAADYDIPAWCGLRGHELLRGEPGRHMLRIGSRPQL